ncbi:tripartite tricarboxylate transporter substrate binding protein [Vibrio quintilis]|uniref:Tripartite tricarboxylate transporter family receptor n=1 Tax=Vibrio quintilis TaxID=1117707 RepID=A0A1M7YQ54_9VIBR|nr:tripartite tricarboxylate transporter substrate-binding protein [Vibrio quintilis]SHO54757.1 Tripartite tricarboxylate transporter family receptor [Vibrio quintilis]
MLNRIREKSRAVMYTVALCCGTMSGAHAATHMIDDVHFLIPGGAGGGWDSTARGLGEALMKSNVAETVSFENMSGGGGGKAIAHLIKAGKQAEDTLMINSTPIIIRALSKVFPQSFHDLTPVAAVVGDYAAFVVGKNSPYQNFQQVVDAYLKNPRSVTIGGGSAKGSMDHLVAALAFQAAGGDPRRVKYIPYDAGGKAMAALLSGEIQVLSTGLSEAINLAQAGEVHILAMTGETRSPVAPTVPTLKELGYDATFVNWRGVFGPPGLSDAQVKHYDDALAAMFKTPEWKTVRDRYGWVDLYKPGPEFLTFLSEQETQIGQLMKTLGFLR